MSKIGDHKLLFEGIRNGAAGICGGSLGILLTHPIDTIRVRMVASEASALQVIKKIYSSSSWRGFWFGVTPPVAIRGCAFGTNRIGLSYGKRISNSVFFQGCCAGFLPALIETPMHVVKIRAQVQNGKSNFQETLSYYYKYSRNLVRTGGIKALYRGFGVSTMIYIPGFGVFYSTYDFFKKKRPSYGLLNPAAAICVSWLFVYPFEVCRTKLVVDKRISYRKLIRYTALHPSSAFRAFCPTLLRAMIRFTVTIGITEYLEDVQHIDTEEFD